MIAAPRMARVSSISAAGARGRRRPLGSRGTGQVPRPPPRRPRLNRRRNRVLLLARLRISRSVPVAVLSSNQAVA